MPGYLLKDIIDCAPTMIEANPIIYEERCYPLATELVLIVVEQKLLDKLSSKVMIYLILL